MATRTNAERLSEIDTKMEQLKAQRKALLQRERQAARKARTKRLVQIGAELEAAVGEPITDLDGLKRYAAKYAYAIKAAACSS